MKNNSSRTVSSKFFLGVLVGVTVFFGYAFIVQTLIPYGKMYSYFSEVSKSMGGESLALSNPRASVYNAGYLELPIRQTFVELFLLAYQKGQLSTYSPLFHQAVEELEKITNERYLECATCYLDIGKGYDLLATLRPADAVDLYAKAEKNYLAGLAIIPDFQTHIMSYSVNLTAQNRTAEGVAMLRKSLAQDDRFPGLHYYLGLLLFREGAHNAPEALRELEIGLSAGINYDPGATKIVYRKMLGIFYGKRDMQNVLTVVRRLTVLDAEQGDTYARIGQWIEEHGQLPVLNFN